MAKEEYCKNICRFYIHKTEKTQIADNFCEIGYKTAPKTEEATTNFLKNGGGICSMNPWKSIAYQTKMENSKGK